MRARTVFERLDQSYMDDLVLKVQRGSSNAYAELLVCTSERLLYYLTHLYGDREQALSALREAYSRALSEAVYIPASYLFMPWLCRIASNQYLQRKTSGSGTDHYYEGVISRLLALPLVESQIMMMTTLQGLTEAETAGILNVGRSTVRRFARLGRKHLSATGLEGQKSGKDSVKDSYETPPDDGLRAGDEDKGNRMSTHMHCRLDPLETSAILESVFRECGMEANTVPAEALASYAVYRSERFSLQRGILIAALSIFMMLPILFLVPGYSVNVVESGDRGLPVYTIDVKSVLPVGRVIANLRNHKLPVYEASAREFTVEPTRNGSMSITVELVNRQSITGTQDVIEVDSESPQLRGTDAESEYLVIYAEDAGIGIDYREIYAISSSGVVHYPVSAGQEGIEFEYPDEPLDVYIPDHIGNTLHLAVRLH